ncbi:MAG: hypothetical protein HC798_00505 [Polaribacter sp.]|nr:hypothetical protein [Polaribacter sp.]
MKKIIRTLAAVLFILVSTVGMAQEFTAKKGGNCFTLDLPSYLQQTFDLNDVAILQYSNLVKEAYVIVIEDSKAELNSLNMTFESAKEFMQDFTKDYQLEATNRTATDIIEFEANNYKHAQTEFTWDSEDGSIYMMVTIVETKGNFYKIMCWTLLENKDLLRDDYLTISKSLKD